MNRCGTRTDARELVEAAIQSSVAKGHVRDSGRRRKGQIVWVSTGKPLPDDNARE